MSNVSSGAHSAGRIDFDDLQGERRYSAWGAYCQSKLANVMFTYELARRLEGIGITANVLHPGVIATGLMRRLPSFIDIPFKLFARSPIRGAETSIYLASSTDVEGITGKYFDNKTEVPSSKVSYVREAQAKLWSVSEKLVGMDSNILQSSLSTGV